jgi:esterase
MELNYKLYGDSGEDIIILHGLFGMLDNWHTLATRMGEKFRVWVVDQRNHGKSPHAEEFDYHILSGDLEEFFGQHGIVKAHITGHSMGGKTAMQFAFDHPDKAASLIVVDIAPRAYDAHHNEIIGALQELDLKNLTRRSEVEDKLAERIPDEDTRMFLLKNLMRETEGFRWKMNLASLADNYDKINGPVDHDRIFDGPALFMRGGRSNYVTIEDEKSIRWLFPKAEFVTIPNVGHWIHAEAPEAFLEATLNFIERSA